MRAAGRWERAARLRVVSVACLRMLQDRRPLTRHLRTATMTAYSSKKRTPETFCCYYPRHIPHATKSTEVSAAWRSIVARLASSPRPCHHLMAYVMMKRLAVLAVARAPARRPAEEARGGGGRAVTHGHAPVLDGQEHARGGGGGGEGVGRHAGQQARGPGGALRVALPVQQICCQPCGRRNGGSGRRRRAWAAAAGADAQTAVLL